MATASGGKCFIWFILICFAVGGGLLWRKYSNAMEKIEAKPDVEETAPAPEPAQELPKPVFTPDEVCNWLPSSNDIRAGQMRDRKYEKKEIKEDNSRLYSFLTKPFGSDKYGYIKFFSHQKFFEVAFNKREDYDTFRKQFHGFQKLGAFGDCLERYAISSECVACEMEFRERANSFLMMIMRSPDFAKSEVRFPPKPTPKPIRSSKDDEWEELIPAKKSNKFLKGGRIRSDDKKN